MEVKASISRALGFAHKQQDVKVTLDGMPSGIWLWEERSETHVHFDEGELDRVLGSSEELTKYVVELTTYNTSWRWINPHRMRLAARG